MREKGTLEEKLALTEQRNPLSEDIDIQSSLEIVELINREDREVAKSVYEARASIATAIDWVAESFWNKGHLFYVGAGTSGRLGQLDAAECPPTFGVSPDQVQALIAGGSKALVKAVEGAEDREDLGKLDLEKKKIGPNDVVIGITSGAATAYVRGALAFAHTKGSKTILLTCTNISERPEYVDLVISALTGPEVITGSTRMKAGSATKMILNMISTGAMIRTGRTYGNLMVDLSCSNRKLVSRGVRMIRNVTRLSEEQAKKLLMKAHKQVKLALAMEVTGQPSSEAARLLEQNHGFLRHLFQRPHTKNPNVDAVIFDMDGTILHYGLPNGFSTWAALGWAFGIYDKMEEWVAQYLNQQIPYEGIWEACAHEISGRTFQEAKDILFPSGGAPPFSRGFRDCARVLRQHYRTGIISSGLTMVSEQIRKSLGLDFEVSNDLCIKEGKFDGTFRIGVPFDQKLEALKAKASELKIPLSRICFVGDSPNDIETLKAVGFPVAYSPKTDSVVAAARGHVIGDFLQLPALIEAL